MPGLLQGAEQNAARAMIEGDAASLLPLAHHYPAGQEPLINQFGQLHRANPRAAWKIYSVMRGTGMPSKELRVYLGIPQANILFKKG